MTTLAFDMEALSFVADYGFYDCHCECKKEIEKMYERNKALFVDWKISSVEDFSKLWSNCSLPLQVVDSLRVLNNGMFAPKSLVRLAALIVNAWPKYKPEQFFE